MEVSKSSLCSFLVGMVEADFFAHLEKFDECLGTLHVWKKNRRFQKQTQFCNMSRVQFICVTGRPFWKEKEKEDVISFHAWEKKINREIDRKLSGDGSYYVWYKC